MIHHIIVWILYMFNWRKALIYHLIHNKGMVLSDHDKKTIMEVGTKKI